MTPVLSRAQIRAYDEYAIGQCGVPGVVLMENAGRGASEFIARLYEERTLSQPVVIVCGTGNNGGDGLVVARHLQARGIALRVFLVGDPKQVKGDAKSNLDAWRGLGGALETIEDDVSSLKNALDAASLAVDALFGTGLTREVNGVWAQLVDALTECACDTVALDIPSGIDADTGKALGTAVRATHTLTFGHRKTGLLQGAGMLHAGEVQCIGLGIFDDAVLAQVGHRAEIIEAQSVVQTVGDRARDTHKYRAGHILLLAGSPGKLGAARLAAEGALRAGAGLLTLASWERCRESFGELPPEIMTGLVDAADISGSLELLTTKKSAIAIGPGLGLDDHARTLVDAVVLRSPLPVVVDADAISLFAGRAESLSEAKGPRVLTPHSGELARLLGSSAAELEADRLSAAEQAAQRCGCVVVYKGPHTIIAAPGREARICTRGNAVLATAGSGDVLTGVIAALLHGSDPLDAASAGVFLHASTGDEWRSSQGADRGMVASDIIAGLPKAFAALSCS